MKIIDIFVFDSLRFGELGEGLVLWYWTVSAEVIFVESNAKAVGLCPSGEGQSGSQLLEGLTQGAVHPIPLRCAAVILELRATQPQSACKCPCSSEPWALSVCESPVPTRLLCRGRVSKKSTRRG